MQVNGLGAMGGRSTHLRLLRALPRLAAALSAVTVVLGIEGLVNHVSAAQENAWARAPVIVATANAWRVGQPIPAELRRYRTSPGDMPVPSDSANLIAEITNLPLLAVLATDLGADPQCREDAFVQGTYSGGPTKFFAALAPYLSVQEDARDPWLVELRGRVAQSHVVVNALFIKDADMPRETALKVLERIEQELRGGAAWDTVYRKYADEFGYRTGNRTKIGNLGRLVVYPDPALGRGRFVKIDPDGVMWKGEELPRRLSRLAFFDASHLPAIMRSSPGDVVRMHSSIYSEYDLYEVEEVYPGVR